MASGKRPEIADSAFAGLLWTSAPSGSTRIDSRCKAGRPIAPASISPYHIPGFAVRPRVVIVFHAVRLHAMEFAYSAMIKLPGRGIVMRFVLCALSVGIAL